MADERPEGTDHIVTGNADMSTAGSNAANNAPRGDAGAAARDFAGQFGDKARDYAEQGKDRATSALDDVARLIGDNAAQLDELLGAAYGDYARRAADYVSGSADAIRGKEIDDLLDDARSLVRHAPAAVVGAGAVVGFALARVIKAGSEALGSTAKSFETGGDRTPKPGATA